MIAFVHWMSNQILVGRCAKDWGFGRLTFPGGKLNSGESHSSCAIRETFEETGLRLAEHELHKVGQYGFIRLFVVLRSNLSLPPGGSDTSREFLELTPG
jgi:8-oxo-dGTP pyrophosphatase MutT (NUDIX family)